MGINSNEVQLKNFINMKCDLSVKLDLQVNDINIFIY